MNFLLNPRSMITDAASGRRLSVAELSAAARGGAARLAALGAEPGKSVLIRHGGTSRIFADLLSVWMTGAAAAFINPSTTASELDRIAGFLAPVAILGDGNGEKTIAGSPAFDLTPAKCATGFSPPRSNLDDNALILFTSGTTGEPKGVVLSFRALLSRVVLNRAFIGDADLETTLCVLPTHFGHGLIGNCLTPLFAGADLVLAPGSDVRSVARLSDVLKQFGVTFMSSVPAFWKIALKAAKLPRESRLRRVHIGSAPLSADLWNAVSDWCGIRNVVNMYGLTEAANWIGGASAADTEPQDGLIGRVWGGAAAIRDEEGRLHASGEGDLVVLTPSLMSGYLHRDDLTSATLKDGWLTTGDVGRINADGTIRLTGRRKYEINRAGLKVHPEDIDILLERHPDVSQACAFGIPDPVMGEAVGVAVVLRDGAKADIRSLRAWVAERLTAEKVPVTWYEVAEIPMSDRGKVNRDHVAKACRDGAAHAARPSGDAA
jgi:acyl-CoA synthetase (AMP-forming)/AMP-acid ligase II